MPAGADEEGFLFGAKGTRPSVHFPKHLQRLPDRRKKTKTAGADVYYATFLLVDVVGPARAEFCRTVANFPQVDDLRFINPWEV
jgi:hypothetical protein